MPFLNSFLASEESLARKIELDENAFEKAWKQYLETIDAKSEIINKLPVRFGEKKQILLKLQSLLHIDLIDTKQEVQDESLIVKRFKSLERSRRIERIGHLENALRYMESRFDYVHQLLNHLYLVLMDEARDIEAIQKCHDLKKYRALVQRLSHDLEAEKQIVKKVESVPTFKKVLHELTKEEHIIHKMDTQEALLLKQILSAVNHFFSEKAARKVIIRFAMAVKDRMEDRFQELMARDIFTEYHEHSDLEFVNSPHFIELVKDTAQEIRFEFQDEKAFHALVQVLRDGFFRSVFG